MHTTTAPPPARSLPDVLLGTLGTVMIVAAVVLLVRWGIEGRGAAPAPPPPLTLVAPAGGAVLSGPFEIVFEAPAQLTATPMGWGAEGLHLHLQLDDQSIMPGAPDVERLAGNRYRWRLPALPPGEHTLRLHWSDAAHLPVAAGASDAVRVYGK